MHLGDENEGHAYVLCKGYGGVVGMICMLHGIPSEKSLLVTSCCRQPLTSRASGESLVAMSPVTELDSPEGGASAIGEEV